MPTMSNVRSRIGVAMAAARSAPSRVAETSAVTITKARAPRARPSDTTDGTCGPATLAAFVTVLVVSPAGAVGLMQIMPAAAKDNAPVIGVSGSAADLNKPEVNLAFGQQHLQLLRNSPGTQGLLPKVIAAYNAGPTRVQALRRKAEAQGLDPNAWFNNVELVSAREIGRQNVDYVRNIMKYWMAFRLADELDKPVYPQ